MKKILSVVLVVFVLMTMSIVSASAKMPVNDYRYEAQLTNGAVINASSSYDVRLAIVEKMVARTNAKIETLVNKAMSEENPNLEALVYKTNALSQLTIKIAEKLGVEVICEYVPYEINGVIVYIDPLIVIRR